MRTKLLLVIPTLDRGGAEKQCVLLASNLPRDEFEVHVAVLTRSGPLAAELKAARIPYVVIGKSWKCDPFAYARLKRHIRNLQPDIVHTWLFAANAYGRWAARAAGVKRIIAGERCVDPWKGAWHRRIDLYLERFTERFATNSGGVVDFYAKRGIPPERFTIIPNGVVLPAKPPENLWLREQLDAALDLAPLVDPEPEPYVPVVVPGFTPPIQPFLIGILARLWPQKRLHEMMWVFESLRFSGMNFHTLILGDGPERERLLRLRDAFRLSDCVHFLGHRNDAPRFVAHFDLLLCPSAYEGQSNAILEAMARGVPVIASDIPGNDELVVPVPNEVLNGSRTLDATGPTGVLIPECGEDFRRRRALFVREILRLYEQPALRKALGTAARQRVAEVFSVEKMVQGYVELYGGGR